MNNAGSGGSPQSQVKNESSGVLEMGRSKILCVMLRVIAY
jgi:hypothetical protein